MVAAPVARVAGGADGLCIRPQAMDAMATETCMAMWPTTGKLFGTTTMPTRILYVA